MSEVCIGSKTYDAEVLKTDDRIQIAITKIGSLSELTGIFAGIRGITIDGEPVTGYEVDSIVLLRSSDSDYWDGRRVTIILRKSN